MQPPNPFSDDMLRTILTPRTHNSEQFAYMSSLASVSRNFRNEVNSQIFDGDHMHDNFDKLIDAQVGLHAPATLRQRLIVCQNREDQVEVLRETRQCVADAYLDEVFLEDILSEMVLFLVPRDGTDEDIAYNHGLLREVMTENMLMNCPIMKQQCFCSHIMMAAKKFFYNNAIQRYVLQIIRHLLSPFAYDFLSDAGVDIILRIFDLFRGQMPIVLAGFKSLLLYSNNVGSITKLSATTRARVVSWVLQIQGQYSMSHLTHQIIIKKGTEILALFMVVPDYRENMVKNMLEQFATFLKMDPTRINMKIYLNVLCMATDQLVDTDRRWTTNIAKLITNSTLVNLLHDNQIVVMTDHEYVHQMLHILKNLATLKKRNTEMISSAFQKICFLLSTTIGQNEVAVDTLQMVQTLIAFVGNIRNLDGHSIVPNLQSQIVNMGIIPLLMARLIGYRNQNHQSNGHAALLSEIALLLYVLVIDNTKHQLMLIDSDAMNILLDVGILKSTQSASPVESRTLYLVCYLLNQNYQYVLARDKCFTTRPRQYPNQTRKTNFDKVLRAAVARPDAAAALCSMFSRCCGQYCAQPTY